MLYRYTLAFIFVIGCSASYAVAKDVDGEPPLSPVMQCIADCYAASGSGSLDACANMCLAQ